MMRRVPHNTYDAQCVRWFGDRSPARNRTGPWKRSGWRPVRLIHREMNGGPVMLRDHRCPTCNPYTEQEANGLLGQ